MNFEELRRKYNPDGSDLRKAQLRMVQMLKFIDDVCTKNGITYWLDAGTLLGAARHGGFIPWDDDTDICMPLSSLLRFKEIMLTNNPCDEFILHCKETDPNHHGAYPVLRDLKSEYIQDRKYHKALKYRGLQVDIFPLEAGIPSFLKKVDIVLSRYLIEKPLKSERFYELTKPIVSLNSSINTNVIYPLLRLFSKKNDDLLYMAYGVPYTYKRYKHDIYPLRRIEFEGFTFNAPNNVDSFLSTLYGNWRKIPEDNKIQTHHVKFRFIDEK